METITINVDDYYGKPLYYSVMPQVIFDALEAAYLNNQPTINVDKELFYKMINDYKLKMQKQ